MFYIAGLLHDADWEKYPEQHPSVIVNQLTEMGEHEIAHAISAHGTEWGVEYITIMDRALVAVDELTGFIYAVAQIRPMGLKGLRVKSVLKKLKNKSFASGVDRKEVEKGVNILGTDIRDLIRYIIAVLQPYSQEIELPEVDVPIEKGKLSIPIETKNIQIAQKVEVQNQQYKRPLLSEQQRIRYAKREEMLASSINPYPGQTFDVTTKSSDIIAGITWVGDYVAIAGRVMYIRLQGKSGFIDLQDEWGKIQLYFNTKGENSLTIEESKLIKKYIDRGDIIGVTGEIFLTKTKAPTIHIYKIILLTKSLRPLPAVKEAIDEDTNKKKIYDAFSNPELRYRQRYVDLIVNQEVRNTFKNRTLIVDSIRGSFNNRDFLEVQTPILQPIYGGATARPFITHHNTLDMKLYLRIANELYLKRLIVGGYSGVYEFSVDFRNEGMSRFHNPEFTQVELYVAYKDYNWMMNLVEETVENVALKIHGTTIINTFGKKVDFKRPWRRISMREAILEVSNIDIADLDEEGLRKAASDFGLTINNEMIGKGKLIDEIFGELVEPNLIQPTFITSYPVELSPLAKRTVGNPNFTDRFEGFVCGKEFCNAFSELNDPVDQRKRFEEQLQLANRGDKEAMMLDEDFLRALEYGMPPTAGLGLGIDRLSMVMLDKQSIQEVIFFPQMKPK